MIFRKVSLFLPSLHFIWFSTDLNLHKPPQIWNRFKMSGYSENPVFFFSTNKIYLCNSSKFYGSSPARPVLTSCKGQLMKILCETKIIQFIVNHSKKLVSHFVFCLRCLMLQDWIYFQRKQGTLAWLQSFSKAHFAGIVRLLAKSLTWTTESEPSYLVREYAVRFQREKIYQSLLNCINTVVISLSYLSEAKYF